MKLNLEFDPETFHSLIGGRAVIETPRLNLKSKDEARAYLKSYGYDTDVEADREKLWQIHSRAVIYIRTQLLQEGESVPEELSDPKQLSDISNLLLIASMRDSSQGSLHSWACALLRVMHVISQLHNDLFNYFSLEIQEEIFRPYRQFVQKDAVSGIRLAGGSDEDVIPLQKFDIKPFKDSDSAITKLLAKPDEVAFGLLDKIGVRFVTATLFDVFRVMRFLVNNHVVSPANVIPNQSNNTLFPANLFLEVVEGLPRLTDMPVSEVDKVLNERLAVEAERARFLEKHNSFTSRDYRFIKFITRQLVRVTHPETQKSFSFFYPYEVQILDYEHYLRSLSGPASHDEYKARQRARARQRVLV
ncbi:MAG: TIGR04552 family protein [Bdellovibrionales bacterium]|nr:TIGR04552 family protein [Bdellovibrionales bacterium]